MGEAVVLCDVVMVGEVVDEVPLPVAALQGGEVTVSVVAVGGSKILGGCPVGSRGIEGAEATVFDAVEFVIAEGTPADGQVSIGGLRVAGGKGAAGPAADVVMPSTEPLTEALKLASADIGFVIFKLLS